MDVPSKNVTIMHLVYYKYASINAVDEERSFLMSKVLLTNNQQSAIISTFWLIGDALHLFCIIINLVIVS